MPRDDPAWTTPVTMRLSYPRLRSSGKAMVAPIAIPATDNPFIAEMRTISAIVPIAKPPFIGPIQTWNILYRSSAIRDSDRTYPMKINIGNVRSGYHFISFMAEAKGISAPPVPHSTTADIAATAPIAPKTRWPVNNKSIMLENMRSAIIS